MCAKVINLGLPIMAVVTKLIVKLGALLAFEYVHKISLY